MWSKLCSLISLSVSFYSFYLPTHVLPFFFFFFSSSPPYCFFSFSSLNKIFIRWSSNFSCNVQYTWSFAPFSIYFACYSINCWVFRNNIFQTNGSPVEGNGVDKQLYVLDEIKLWIVGFNGLILPLGQSLIPYGQKRWGCSTGPLAFVLRMRIIPSASLVPRFSKLIWAMLLGSGVL